MAKGYNKKLRGQVRALLCVYSIAMIAGYPEIACAFAAGATTLVMQGDRASARNLAWSIACWISLPGAIVAACCRRGAASVDADRAYSLHTGLMLVGRGTEVVVGGLVGFLLVQILLSKINNASRANELEKRRASCAF